MNYCVGRAAEGTGWGLGRVIAKAATIESGGWKSSLGCHPFEPDVSTVVRTIPWCSNFITLTPRVSVFRSLVASATAAVARAYLPKLPNALCFVRTVIGEKNSAFAIRLKNILSVVGSIPTPATNPERKQPKSKPGKAGRTAAERRSTSRPGVASRRNAARSSVTGRRDGHPNSNPCDGINGLVLSRADVGMSLPRAAFPPCT